MRQRLALKAAASSARLARLREVEVSLRDAEHLAVSGENSPAGRRLFASPSMRLDASTLRMAADSLA